MSLQRLFGWEDQAQMPHGNLSVPYQDTSSKNLRVDYTGVWKKSIFTSGGQTHTTISTKLEGDISQLPHKRPRMDSFIDSANTQ